MSNKNITLYETTALYQILKSKILQKYSLENCKKNIFIDDTVEDVEKLEKNKEKLQVEFQKIYENLEKAFAYGTIFEELYKPFTGRRCVR